MSESHHSIDDLYNELHHVKREVHSLALTKQDRVKPAVVISVLLFLFAQSGAAMWWASRMETTVVVGLATLSEKVGELGEDRFYGRDGEQMERYLISEINALKSEVNDLKHQIRETRTDINENNSKIAGLKSVQTECQKRLQMKQQEEEGF